MRTLSRVDLELGRVIETLPEDSIEVYGECDIPSCESLIIHDSIYSEIYLSQSLIEGDKSKIRIKKEGLGDKVKYTIKLPPESIGGIYVVRSLRAYKYTLTDNKVIY